MNGILEWPQVQLVHCRIIDIRRQSLYPAARLSMAFLLVRDEMLRRCNYPSTLNSSHCLGDENTGKIGIGRDAFPVPAARDSSP